MIAYFDDFKKVVGVNQVKKALLNKEAERVYIAKDAEKKVVDQIIQLCKETGIEIVYVDTMRELGQQCNIDVRAASAAILKKIKRRCKYANG